MTVKKYFLAIVIPEPLFEKTEAVKQKLFEDHGLKGALRSPAHITLHRPFEWKEEKEDLLIKKLCEFKFGRSISVDLKNFGCFEPKVLFIDVVENTELNDLQNGLVQFVKFNLNIFNQANDLRAYHPHVTIAFRDLKKELFYKAWEEYKNKVFDASFTVNNFVLLKHNGSVWRPRADFNL